MRLKRSSIFILFLISIAFSAHSFTIVTQIKESSLSIDDGAYASLEPIDFVINATRLEAKYPWHGIYHIIPSSYKPPQKDGRSGNYLERCAPSDKRAVLVWFLEPKSPDYSFSIDLERKVAEPDWTKLDCEAGVGYTPWADIGKVIHCDTMHRADGIGKSGIIEYRIDSIEGPEYICRHGTGLFGVGYACNIQEQTDRTVRINFSVRFGLDNSTYSDWISSPDNITINGVTYRITASQRNSQVEVAGDELGRETSRALGGSAKPSAPSGDHIPESSECSLHIVSVNGNNYASLADDQSTGVKKIGCAPNSIVTVVLSGSPGCVYESLSAKIASGVSAGGASIIGTPQYSLTLEGADTAASALSNGNQATVSFVCERDKIDNAPFLQFYADARQSACETAVCEAPQTVMSEIVKLEIAVESPTGSETVAGQSPTVQNLDNFLRGIGECSSDIQSVEIVNSIENGKIYICDDQRNAVSNTISVALGDTSCSVQQTCVTLWRQNPLSASCFGSADLDKDGTVEDAEKYYFTLLWWLYVVAEHYELEPYGTDSESDFKAKAEETLSSYFYEQLAMITWDNWFVHNTYTKCFAPSEPLSFSISKDSTETSFLNPDVGLFEQNVYLTVQQLADYEGKHIWFISNNYFTLPLVNNCAEVEQEQPQEKAPTEQPLGPEQPEQPSGQREKPIVSSGPVNPEEQPGQPSGPSPPVELAGCNPCLSPIGCLGCIDILVLQSIPSG